MTSQPDAVPAPEPDPIPEKELRAWLRLANLQFSPRVTHALLDGCGDRPHLLFEASDAQIAEIAGLHPRQLARLRDEEYLAAPRQWTWMQRDDVSFLQRNHPAFPRPLLEIGDPPAFLFVRGRLEETDRLGIGIVGSRHATPYGRSTAERLARELAGHGLTIISGGAVGIDAAAHRGALSVGGRTLAFLGCGLDVDYPRDNRALFDQIAANGAILSEYPPGAQPEAWRFPQRNRLISALAQGVLVVEAPQSSGALITARCAVEQGRPVMAIPGNIDRPSSVGCNRLLQDGATLVMETRDILQALGMLVLPPQPAPQPALELSWDDADAPSAETSPPTAPSRPPLNLSPVQQALLGALSLTPRHIDAIAREAGLSATQAGVELTLLELTGAVRRLPGNSYIRAL